MNGIFFFCMTYGLIEVANAIYLNKINKLDLKGTIIIVFWGLCIFFVAIDETLGDESILKNVVYLLFGSSWLLMLQTPCNVPVFRDKNKYVPISRKIIFMILAVLQFITVLKDC